MPAPAPTPQSHPLLAPRRRAFVLSTAPDRHPGPNGGIIPRSREAISSSRKESRLPETSARITGSSGFRVCISTSPGFSPRPERPDTWCSN
jgi:hypothetical protein